MGISDEEETIMAQLTRRTLLTTGSLAAAGVGAGPGFAGPALRARR